MGCKLRVRDTLLSGNVDEAAVDYDAGLAYVMPKDGYTADDAIAALAKTDRYKGKVKN